MRPIHARLNPLSHHCSLPTPWCTKNGPPPNPTVHWLKAWVAHRTTHRYSTSARLPNRLYNAIDERFTIRRAQTSHVIPAGTCG